MATQYFGGNNLSAIGTITAIAMVLTGGISALFGNFTSVQAVYTSSTNMYAANIVATSSAILPSNTTIDTKSVCLGDGSNCLLVSTPTLGQVSMIGSSATPTLNLYGGFIAASSTVTSTFTVLGDASFVTVTATQATTSIFAVYSQLTAATTTMNGSFYANTGTAALPSSSFKGDRDTGLYSAAANQLGFSAGGSARLLISSTAVSAGTTNSLTLGTQAIVWSTIFGTSVSSTNSTSTFSVIGTSLLPSGNNGASIGSSAKAFANIFASGTIRGDSLFLGEDLSGTSTLRIGTSGFTGGCLTISDVDRSGVTYCTANNGILTCSTTSCE